MTGIASSSLSAPQPKAVGISWLLCLWPFKNLKSPGCGYQEGPRWYLLRCLYPNIFELLWCKLPYRVNCDYSMLITADSKFDSFLEFFLQQHVAWGRSFQFCTVGRVVHELMTDWATFTFLTDFQLSCICAFQHTWQCTLHKSKLNAAKKLGGASLTETHAGESAQVIMALRKCRTYVQVVL